MVSSSSRETAARTGASELLRDRLGGVSASNLSLTGGEPTAAAGPSENNADDEGVVGFFAAILAGIWILIISVTLFARSHAVDRLWGDAEQPHSPPTGR